MRLTILKTGRPSDALVASRGDYDRFFADAFGWPIDRFDVIDAPNGDPLPAPDTMAGLVVTGSPLSVHDHHPWSVRASAWMLQAVRAGVPTLGVCYGHHMLGDVLGAEVGLNPSGREIGVLEVELDDDPLFEGLPRRMPTLMTHSDAVNTVPEGCEVIARSAMTPICALRFGPMCRTVQWHPEFDAHILRTIVREREAAIDGETGPGSAQRAYDSIVGVHTGPIILRNFVRHFVTR